MYRENLPTKKKKKEVIICPQCKTKVPVPSTWCYFCDMKFEEMIVKYICNTCKMHFTSNFKVTGNDCRRSGCGSRDLKLIYRQSWMLDEINYLLTHLNEKPDRIARRLKRPVGAVKRKLHRLKKEIKKEMKK